MGFPLHGSAHHVERGRKSCSPEEVAYFEGCGRVVDHAAVYGQAGMDDEDFDIWGKTVFCLLN